LITSRIAHERRYLAHWSPQNFVIELAKDDEGLQPTMADMHCAKVGADTKTDTKWIKNDTFG
jgi:hypothetical protein